jgi:hypothetical protein
VAQVPRARWWPMFGERVSELTWVACDLSLLSFPSPLVIPNGLQPLGICYSAPHQFDFHPSSLFTPRLARHGFSHAEKVPLPTHVPIRHNNTDFPGPLAKSAPGTWATREASAKGRTSKVGGRYRIRTYDFHRVKMNGVLH